MQQQSHHHQHHFHLIPSLRVSLTLQTTADRRAFVIKLDNHKNLKRHHYIFAEKILFIVGQIPVMVRLCPSVRPQHNARTYQDKFVASYIRPQGEPPINFWGVIGPPPQRYRVWSKIKLSFNFHVGVILK